MALTALPYLARAVIALAVSYLLGSIPWAYLVVKYFAKKDVRKIGSKNIGTLNTFRATKNFALALLVLLLDAGKGIASVLLARYLNLDELLVGLAAMLAVLGHNYSIFMKFQGGRGLATTYGIYLVEEPRALLLTFAVWLPTYIVSGYVILGAILAIPVVILWFFLEGSLKPSILLASLACLPKLWPKLKNIIEGKEPKHFWTAEAAKKVGKKVRRK